MVSRRLFFQGTLPLLAGAVHGLAPVLAAQTKGTTALAGEALAAMKKAARYMVETVSTNGGYVWSYLPDLSRRWGEMEAYDTMIWVQSPGTPEMGHLFLDAYQATGDSQFFQAADRAARALIYGQLECGGWNYMIDFAGDRSLKQWYATIGKSGWRLEEFQHYYGNGTFDDDVSSEVAKFLLRMYVEDLDPRYKPALDKAIQFVLNSQYPNGGWPQRYPLKYDFQHHGHPDYTSYCTFNDDVVWENVNFLIQCYLTLGEERYLDPIRRGMNFYLITQQGAPQAGWGQQYTLDLKPAAARTYEPAGVLPDYTSVNIQLLEQFYRLTGETKFLAGIPAALDWLEKARLPQDKTEGGRYTHPRFIEVGTGKPLYVHRKGSNVTHGYYYVDYHDEKLLGHYRGKCSVDVDALRKEYEAVKAISPAEAMKASPLQPGRFEGKHVLPQKYYELKGQKHSASSIDSSSRRVPGEEQVRRVIAALDPQGRWLSKHASTSNPYTGEGTKTELTDAYASTNVGDETDTSPFRDSSDQDYLSTRVFLQNMNLLTDYVKASGVKGN